MDTYHYEGEVRWKKILRPHGPGTLTCYAEGGGPGAEDAFSWKYKGEFDQGHATGEGTTTYGDPYPDDPALAGQIYIGAHVDGEPHGQGTWYYRGGAVQYVGNHQNGKCHGQGTWYYPDRAMQYVGDNQDEEYHGQGASYRHDGEVRENDTRENGTREYEGQWVKNCWRGNGTLYLPNGDISREGTWVNGGSAEYERQGKMCRYEGDWDEGERPHGWGILYQPDGTVVEGWWQNGESVGGPPSGYPEPA